MSVERAIMMPFAHRGRTLLGFGGFEAFRICDLRHGDLVSDSQNALGPADDSFCLRSLARPLHAARQRHDAAIDMNADFLRDARVIIQSCSDRREDATASGSRGRRSESA